METSDPIAASKSIAAAILAEAGWAPMPGWGGYIHGPCVGGVDPWSTPRFKSIEMIPPGHPQYSPDYPDEHHEAAAWLVEHAKALHRVATPAADLTTEATLEPPEAEIRTTDVPRETSPEPVSQAEAAAIAEVEGLFSGGEPEYVPEDEHLDTGLGVGGGEGAPETLEEPGGREIALGDTVEPDPYDAEFYNPDRIPIEGEDLAEPPLLEGDLGAEILDEGQAEPDPLTGQDRFIGLDDLDRRRSLRIGDVMRHARALMPPWTTNDDAALRELRNYAAAVGEGRWPYDEGRRQELDALEATLARISVLVKARDERVEFLEGASREEVETFDPEAGWPE